MSISLFKKNLSKIFWFRHKKKKNRKKIRKHLQKFFYTRKKKYLYYYKKCLLFKSKNKAIFENNFFLNQTKKDFNLGIKTLDSGIINYYPLKSFKFVSQRFMRSKKLEKYFRHKLDFSPDFILTSKPKAVRMGKGKGPVKNKVYFVKKGRIIFNIKYNKNYSKFNLNKKFFFLKINIFLHLLMARLKNKIPFRSLFFKKLL